MATPTKLLLSLLRRTSSRRPLSSLSLARLTHPLSPPSSNPSFASHTSPPTNFSSSSSLAGGGSLVPSHHFFFHRSFSSRPGEDSEILRDTASELGVGDVPDGVLANGGVGVSGVGEDSSLPVRAIVSMLDGFHDLTGLPWWAVIVLSTVAMRATLFPLLVLQLHKTRKFQESLPKLPPPFPTPLSGKSYIDQFWLFRKERRAIGCPSFFWHFAFFSVQVPCFLLWMTSIRRMSLDHHPGFDCGGALWFQNLTEFPQGVMGIIFPFLISGLHYVNVRLSFEKSSLQNPPGLLGLLVKYYKTYLEFLTLPLIFVGFCLPQGSLVYWVTNSSISAVQQLSLKHPDVQTRLGLPAKDSQREAGNPDKVDAPTTTSVGPGAEWRRIPVETFPPEELLSLSIQLLSNKQEEMAISMLCLALEKDPDYVRALAVLGQVQFQNGLYEEAIGPLERAISKLTLAGQPTEPEDVDILILASQWAGVAYIQQGKNAEGIMHLERIASLTEPEDPKIKNHYFDGLVVLAGALAKEGRKAEAAKHLRLAVAHKPAYIKLLERWESEEDNLDIDLVNSRRGDY